MVPLSAQLGKTRQLINELRRGCDYWKSFLIIFPARKHYNKAKLWMEMHVNACFVSFAAAALWTGPFYRTQTQPQFVQLNNLTNFKRSSTINAQHFSPINGNALIHRFAFAAIFHKTLNKNSPLNQGFSETN